MRHPHQADQHPLHIQISNAHLSSILPKLKSTPNHTPNSPISRKLDSRSITFSITVAFVDQYLDVV